MHTRRWIQSGTVHAAYASLLQEHDRNHPSKHHIVDSTHVQNAFGRVGLGRDPVDRGRTALKQGIRTHGSGRHRAQHAVRSSQDIRFPPLHSDVVCHADRPPSHHRDCGTFECTR
eukprot:1241972-Prymnesium_polylepis.1